METPEDIRPQPERGLGVPPPVGKNFQKRAPELVIFTRTFDFPAVRSLTPTA